MPQRRGKTRNKKNPKQQTKAATVRKLSPEQPAARDEGPRLIPLGPGKDAGIGRIEHYLELADKALGHTPVKAPAAEPARPEPTAQISLQQISAAMVEEGRPARPDAPSAASLNIAQLPHPPRLQVPKPPPMTKLPKLPKLTRPMPPKAPRFPKPPKLSVPKLPRRKNTSS